MLEESLALEDVSLHGQVQDEVNGIKVKQSGHHVGNVHRQPAAVQQVPLQVDEDGVADDCDGADQHGQHSEADGPEEGTYPLLAGQVVAVLEL